MIYNAVLKLHLQFLTIMVDSKIYLNVPYAEKDTAKVLGARWDARKKKWYAPGNLNIALFEKWNKGVAVSSASKEKSKSSLGKPALGAITHAKDKSFVAYGGEQPPWG